MTTRRRNKGGKGYGQCNVRRFGKTIYGAHVLAWVDHHGRLPPADKSFICHYCDNPGCIEPTHLWAGTQVENNRDRDLKGRHARLSGEAHGQAKLTTEQVAAIRSEYGGFRGHPNQRELAAKYGVSRSIVNYIITGQRW